MVWVLNPCPFFLPGGSLWIRPCLGHVLNFVVDSQMLLRDLNLVTGLGFRGFRGPPNNQACPYHPDASKEVPKP